MVGGNLNLLIEKDIHFKVLGDIQQHTVISTTDTQRSQTVPSPQTSSQQNHINATHENQVANEEVIDQSSEHQIVYDGQMKFISLLTENITRPQSIVQLHPSTIYQSCLDSTGRIAILKISLQLKVDHTLF